MASQRWRSASRRLPRRQVSGRRLPAFLAWRMWSAPPGASGKPDAAHGRLPNVPRRPRGDSGNPKIMVFYLALLPSIIDLAGITPLAWLELTATMLAILAVIDLGYIVLAARARRLPQPARASDRQPHQRHYPRRRRRHAGHAVTPRVRSDQHSAGSVWISRPRSFGFRGRRFRCAATSPGSFGRARLSADVAAAGSFAPRIRCSAGFVRSPAPPGSFGFVERMSSGLRTN